MSLSIFWPSARPFNLPPGLGTRARPTPSAISSVLINVVIPVDPAIEVALSGPSRKMSSTRAAIDLASSESTLSAADITGYVVQVMAGTLVLACTGTPLNGEAIIQGATAHSHLQFVALLQGRMAEHAKVGKVVNTAIVILEDIVNRCQLCAYIESAAAAQHRPIVTSISVQLAPTAKLIRTRKGQYILGLWDLRWAPVYAANAMMHDLPALSSPQSTATVMADSISREIPIACARLKEALALS